MRPSPALLAAVSSLAGALLGALVALQLGVVVLGGGEQAAAPPSAPAPASVPDPVATAAREQASAARPASVPPRVLRERRSTIAALGVLRRWDARRAEAWERGEAALLGTLYTPGSRAGRRDVALLTRYAERGWSVRATRPQVLTAEAPISTRDRVRVRVSERYRDDDRRERVVTLERSRAGWQVDSVTAA